MYRLTLPVTLAAVLASGIAGTVLAEPMGATATLTGSDGATIGTVNIDENGNGVLIRAELSGLPSGWHGFHLHETGSCDDGFKAAGDHYNPGGKEHGTLNPNGAHAGDLPNIWVANDGSAGHHVVTGAVTLAAGAEASLMDDDGSAVVIHENPDSYEQDAGAGGRIACGVIEAK